MTPVDLLQLGRRRLPVIIAAEAAECGLACLAMVGAWHGHKLDLNGLRQRYPVSLSGVKLRTLIELADLLSLSGRALRVEMDALANVKLPAIVHWDFNHFVVLKSVKRNRLVIHDPAVGERILSPAEFSKHFTGVLLELTRSANFRPMETRERVRLTDLWSGSHGLTAAVLQLLAISAALQLVAFAAPFQIQLVVDQAITHGDTSVLSVIAMAFGLLVLLQGALGALRSWSIQIFGNSLAFQISGNLIRHLMRLPADYFEKRHVGDLLSRLGSTAAIQDILSRGAVAAVIDGAMALLALVILLLYSPLLTVVVVVTVLLHLLANVAFYPAIRARSEEQLVSSGLERSHLMETLRAAATIKLMGQESQRESAWRNLYANFVNASLGLGGLRINLATAQGIISGLSLVTLIYLGARQTISGDGLSIGMLLAFLAFRQTFMDRALSLIDQVLQFRLLGLHLERISDIAATKPEYRDGDQPPVTVTGGIALNNVHFRYGISDPWILKAVSLSIQPGEFIAITGSSGGGKSTLLKILLGLHLPNEGEVLLDDQTATPERWRGWRRQISVVSQDDRLLSGTIAENISFFDPDLDMARVEEAARLACIHDEILRMPMQYLAFVGDMGSTLSGGQRQRVMLARALYRRPSVLVLDEGTANLDAQSEEKIAEMIAKLSITRIVVTHRPALLNRADREIKIERPSQIELSQPTQTPV